MSRKLFEDLEALDTFECYETPEAFTTWLFFEMERRGHPIRGQCFEPSVGGGAIPRAYQDRVFRHQAPSARVEMWRRNDIDTGWPADTHMDAREAAVWTLAPIDFTVTNPAFSLALDVVRLAYEHSRLGVALHVRCTFNEPTKNPPRERASWLREHPPTGTLWLPRYSYRATGAGGKRKNDSATCVWMVWLKEAPAGYGFTAYAPDWVIDEASRPLRRSLSEGVER